MFYDRRCGRESVIYYASARLEIVVLIFTACSRRVQTAAWGVALSQRRLAIGRRSLVSIAWDLKGIFDIVSKNSSGGMGEGERKREREEEEGEDSLHFLFQFDCCQIGRTQNCDGCCFFLFLFLLSPPPPRFHR